MRARDIMSHPVITVRPDTPLKDAARLMIDGNMGALPVTGKDGWLVGIVTETDLAPYGALQDPRNQLSPPRDRVVPATVGSLMTRDVIALPESADISWVAETMLRHKIKRIPITSAQHVIGIVSQRDLLKVLIRDDEAIRAEIQELLDEEIAVIGRHEVEVRQGVATLRSAEPLANRRLAARLAHSVPGVLKVDTNPAAHDRVAVMS